MKTKTNKSNKTAKRSYTKRGTTVAGKRVVLIDGVPVGRGRPAKDGKGTRTVVFVPVGETYDAAKHGTGVRFNTAFHGVLKRLKVNKVVETVESFETTPVEVVAPVEVATVESTETVAEAVAAAESPVGASDKF